MLRACFLSLVAYIGFDAATADEKSKPHGPAPQLMVVSGLSRNGIKLEQRTPGRHKADLVRDRVYELDFADFDLLDATRKHLTQEQFRKRVAGDPVVVVFAENVEPAYCRILRPETVVLVVKRGKLEPTIESELLENKVVPEDQADIKRHLPERLAPHLNRGLLGPACAFGRRP